ncbi:MAG TPA: hypothetical protein GX696_07740, partial [Pseudomonadaceae bacterium]|nr:hypothetical protein [Pseudomonadaceae bacterium]
MSSAPEADKLPGRPGESTQEQGVAQALPELTVEDIFHVFDVDDAEPLAGDLFRRRFHTDTFPSEPLHFVGM